VPCRRNPAFKGLLFRAGRVVAAARFHLRVLRSAEEAVPGQITWRLLATNNRDLGRATSTYPDAAECRAAVRQLQDRADRLRAVTVRTGSSAWSWRLLLDGAVVAVSSRDYQRRIHADYAGAVVLDLVPKAELADLDSAER